MRRVAVHEAGHAIVGRALGLSCGKVTIEPEDMWRVVWSASGQLEQVRDGVLEAHAEIWRRWYPERDASRQELDHAYVTMSLAGAEAERVIFGNIEPDCNAGDLRITNRVIGDNPALLAKLRKKARSLVRKNRSDIERVAKSLLHRGTLFSMQVDRLLMGWTDEEVGAGRLMRP